MPDNKDKNPPKGNIRFNITLSEEQKLAKAEILNHPYNFIIGKAGSGKTLLAVQVALDMFFKRNVNQIIITRPTVSNEDNGYLPGSLNEKMEPWLVPIRSNMRKVYNKPGILEKMENDENIELVSLSHFRGRTFEDACVIIDEEELEETFAKTCNSLQNKIQGYQTTAAWRWATAKEEQREILALAIEQQANVKRRKK